MKKLILITFLSFYATLTLSAQKLDSLQHVLDTAKNEYKVKTLNELFRAYLGSDPVKAVGYAREALSLATEVNDKKGLAASYNNLGIAYRNHGAYEKAISYYMTSLRMYETLGNKEGIATTKNNISNIYAIKKDYGQAMSYLQDSYNIFLELNDQQRIVGSKNNLGNLHLEIQLYEKALKDFSEAYQLSERLGAPFADPLNNIGNIYFQQNNYMRAVENYERALAIERNNDNKLGILNVVTNLGITYAKAKQPKPAQQYLEEAVSLAQLLDAQSFFPAIYKAIAETYAVQGQWQDAYKAQLRYDEAREKIFGEESTRKIAQMEMVLNFEEKEKEFDELKQEDEIKTLELQRTRLVIVMVILTILIVLGVLNYYFLSKKKVFRK